MMQKTRLGKRFTIPLLMSVLLLQGCETVSYYSQAAH